MYWTDDTIEMVEDSDREYDRYLETGEIATIADYDNWTIDAYEINDPKHPNYHDTYSEIADSYDPF